MRRSHIGSLCHGSVVSCERIGVDHLSVGKVGRNTCVGVIVPHGIAGRGRVPGQRQSGVILPRHLDTVRLARQGDVDRFAVESDLLDRRQIPVSGRISPPSPHVRSRECASHNSTLREAFPLCLHTSPTDNAGNCTLRRYDWTYQDSAGRRWPVRNCNARRSTPSPSTRFRCSFRCRVP